MPDGDRQSRIESFLAAAGWGPAARRPLPGDASFRRYTLLDNGGRRALLMDAPPEREDVRPYLRIARHLRGLGFSAPGVLAEDAAAGLLVIEDLGDDTYTRLLDGGHDADPLYGLAVDVLADLHRRPPDVAVPSGLAPYDADAFLAETLLFADWYLPAMTGEPVSDSVRDAYAAAWSRVLAPVCAQPRTLVLRDYHVDNLILIPGRPGLAACGLLDFQDALAGPAAYDLMSLLEDARRDIDDGLAARMKARYREAVPTADWTAFDTAYTILAAQRHVKVIGIFTRLMRRDGKPRYLAHLPRLWRLAERALADPALAPVADWMERHVPAHRRGVPEVSNE